jgi:predicted DNA binding CopG/RHH family protein
MKPRHLNKMPSLRSDAAARRHVATSDLTTHDLSEFKPMRFEIEPKSAALNVRLPHRLLEAIKAEARARGIPYTRYVRMVLEKAVDGSRAAIRAKGIGGSRARRGVARR